MTYEEQAKEELKRWLRKMKKSERWTNRIAKKVQNKINEFIPEKVHSVFTASIKKMVQAALIGSEYITKMDVPETLTLEQREKFFQETLEVYKKTAAIEGAGTGAGGILLAMADFALLLGIKMKFLFSAAAIYGFDVKDYKERLYILYLFQLAFSSEEKRKEVLEKIVSWDEYCATLPDEKTYLETIDWKSFQLEYRDHIDLVKMLQLLPGFGAVVGFFANYHFLDVLGETAMNGYRLRYFKKIF